MLTTTTHAPRRIKALTALMIAAIAALAFALSSAGPQHAQAASIVTINIKDYAYSKPSVTVKVGTVIKWVNKDSMKHNATSSKAGGPKGPLLAKGKSYSWKATKKGTFAYFCTPHPYMKGKIVVK